MSDIELTSIGSGYNLGKINQNFEEVERVVNDEVFHTTGGNNVMGQELDMNGKRILNTPTPSQPTDVIRLVDVDDLINPPVYNLGTDVTKFVSEVSTLASGQLRVTFTKVKALGIALYVSGPSADDGRLIEGVHFHRNPGVGDYTIDLTNSYASGVILAAYNYTVIELLADPVPTVNKNQITLTSGQIEVTFSTVKVDGMALYVSGVGTDNGRLHEDLHYTLKALEGEYTIDLINSYPTGSVLVAYN